jgi:hypothetical protein
LSYNNNMHSESDYYVYVLYRQNEITPFYIGKGRGRRWNAHTYERKNTYRRNIIRQMQSYGLQVPKRKIAEGLTNADACAMERELIAFVGRRHEGGPLVNMTGGGEGAYRPSPEHRERLRLSHLGKRNSPETRAKLSAAMSGKCPVGQVKAAAANVGRVVTAEMREKISTALTGRNNGPPSETTREKISFALTGKSRPPQSAESNQKRSDSLRASWADLTPEQRLRRGMFGKKHSPETKEKMRQARLRRIANKSGRDGD